MATNVPAPVWTLKGFLIPSQADILEGVQADINAAFGGNLNPALDTPQGQIASSNTAAIGNANETFLYYTNQVDPAFAEGRMQDAIGRIYYIERNPGSATSVQCVCTGLPNVVIQVGSLARAADGNIYICQQEGIIPTSGSITLTFACSIYGPISCEAHSVTQIYKSINGWDTINNPDAGITGTNVENRADFELRRSLSTALNSTGSIHSVRGAVLTVDGVTDAFVTENPANSALTIGGVSLAPHSLYVCVAGGAAADIANAIWTRKAPGCDYNGSTSFVIYDTVGYSPPYPAYTVKYQVANPLTIGVAVKLVNNVGIPANALALVQEAVVGAFAGADGRTRSRIGTKVLASRFYAPVMELGSWANIFDILVTSPNDSTGAFMTASISGTTLTVSGVSSGVIAVNQLLMDNTGAVLPGTFIVGGSGTSWVVNKAQSVGSEPMTSAYVAQFSQTVNIDQIPVALADNVFLQLV